MSVSYQELQAIENRIDDVITILRRIKRNPKDADEAERYSRNAIRELEDIQSKIRSLKSFS